MKKQTPSYQRHPFPSEIISHAVWLYHRFCLSFREVEELLAERGITVTYETVRQWCRNFGPDDARKLKKRQGRFGDTWHLLQSFLQKDSVIFGLKVRLLGFQPILHQPIAEQTLLQQPTF
jgi:transposase-like protein